MQKLSAKQEQFCRVYKEGLHAFSAAFEADFDFCTLEKGSQLFYVYLLIDPNDGQIFYVGKGKGRRMYQHVRAALNGDVDNSAKYDRIKQILDSGQDVVHKIFSLHEKEDDAFAVEKMLIEEFAPLGLTNIVHGVVTENQWVNRRAKILLEMLKPFETWEAGASPDVVASCISLCGSMQAFYDEVRKTLEDIVRRTE
jgi:hypothetical protein